MNFQNFERKDRLKYSHKNNQSNIEWASFSDNSHLNKNQLNITVVDEAYVVSDAPFNGCFTGGVFDCNRLPIKSSFVRKYFEQANELASKTDFDKADYLDIEAIYLGQVRNHWGSFLVDSVSRLWYGLDSRQNNVYVISLTMPSVGLDFHKNIYRFFELLGIKKEQLVIINKTTIIKKLIIPDLSFVPFTFYSKDFLRIFDLILENNNIPKSPYKKIYFSRGKFSSHSKTDFGEDQLVSFFSENGFKIIYPEEHDLIEQISFINGCDVFATIGGSLAHNIVFLNQKNQNKPIMYLFNRMDGYQWHQWLLNEAVSVPINYIDSFNEPYRWVFKTLVNGPFLYGLNKNVKRFI